MSSKEARTPIKNKRLLEEAGWRFFHNAEGKANIGLQKNVKIRESDLEKLGNDFENCRQGFIDYLLLDGSGFPLLVLEAKREDKDPLEGVGKKQ